MQVEAREEQDGEIQQPLTSKVERVESSCLSRVLASKSEHARGDTRILTHRVRVRVMTAVARLPRGEADSDNEVRQHAPERIVRNSGLEHLPMRGFVSDKPQLRHHDA